VISNRPKRPVSILTVTAVTVALLASVNSAAYASSPRPVPVPEWARPAVTFLVDIDAVERADFFPNQPMTRAAFKRSMSAAFGGGYSRTKGKVTAAEVSSALVRALGLRPLADRLTTVKSPDGWDPQVKGNFGTEVVARELGLRHDRPTTEEVKESSADDAMTQADAAFAIWKAKTDPDTWAAAALERFALGTYDGQRREVVKFALSLVGTPYVWGGEWTDRTPEGYPYGAQPAGGVDCSGFLWNVLQEKSAGYSPPGRGYAGWAIPERSSSAMAAATPRNKRLRLAEMKAGDIVLFAPDGRDGKASEVSHAALYLGEGWIIHSSGSRAGVSLASIAKGSYWHDQILWGRRVITN
jgi:cell wall-associated NlpC family hydrolase